MSEKKPTKAQGPRSGRGAKPRKTPGRAAKSAKSAPTAAPRRPKPPRTEPVIRASEPNEGFDTFVRDVLTFLGHFERHPARRVATGGIGKKTLHRIAPWLRRADDDYASFLAVFLIERRALFEGEERWEVSRPNLARLWTPERLLRAAFHFWLRTPLWNESLRDPDVLSFVRREYLSPDPMLESRRRRLCEELSGLLREGTESFEQATLASRLDRSFQPRPRSADEERSSPYGGRLTPVEALSRMVRGPVTWLGLLEPPGPGTDERRITPLGRRVLVEDWDGVVHALGNRLFDPGARITVQANLEVLAPPDLDPGAYLNLARLADLQTVDVMTTFNVTWDSLMNALDRGSTAKQVLGFLTSTNATELPETVRQLIDDCEGRHGEVRLGVAGPYLETREPALLAEIEANPRLSPWIQRTLGDRIVLLVANVDLPTLTRELRRSGYSVSSAGPEKLQVRASGAQLSVSHPELEELYAAVRSATKLASEVDPDFDLSALESLEETLALELTRQEDSQGQTRARELEALVEQLLQAHGRPARDEAIPAEAKELDDVRMMLETAVERKIPVEIEYDGFQGVTHRIVEPAGFDGRYVTGFCRLRQDQRVFNSARILAARLVL